MRLVNMSPSTQSASVEPRASSQVGRWFAVHTQPHRELPAEQRLQAQGFTTFVPKIDRTIRHARKISQAQRPFFPGYLFVQFDPGATAWRAINGTVGVKRLVMHGDRPAPIRRGVIETMLQSVDEAGHLLFSQPLKPGDKVRLINGPFAYQLGELQQLRANDRARVLLSMLDSTVPIVTRRQDLVPAD